MTSVSLEEWRGAALDAAGNERLIRTVLFLAIFFTAVVHLRLSEMRTLVIVFLALFAALAVAQLTPLPVPALAPMGAAVVAANLRHACFTREEKVALIYGGAFALLLAIVMVLAARRLAG